MSAVIYACDVGSTRKDAFAWARLGLDGGNPSAARSIDALVARLVEDMRASRSVALGIECPLFMPISRRSEGLSRGRNGEGARAMFAPAGAAVATLGLHQAAWILRQIRERVRALPTYTLDWRGWPPADDAPQLLLWEAFVSGAAHSESHERDAATAAIYFRDHERDLAAVNAITTEQSLSMIHAAALWAGVATDLDRLCHACLVLKPDQPFVGDIDTEEPPMPKSWLKKRVTVAEAEADNAHQVDALGPTPVPFAYSNAFWRGFLANARPGDELWEYSTPASYWKNLAGSAGYALVRDGEVVHRFDTELN